MVGCCVPRCGHNSSKPTHDDRFPEDPKRNITYHQFPANPRVRSDWIRILHDGGRPEEWEPTNNTKICSLHFDLDDLKTTDKGTQILKGANPKVPKTENKKPLRRSKAKTKEAFEKIVQDAVVDDELPGAEQFSADLFTNSPSTSSADLYMNSPSTSSAEEYSLVDDVLEEPVLKRKKVAMLPSMAEESSQVKKVVRMADNHTFEAVAGATYEDPCLNTYSELMDLIKKFNQQMSIHHPSKSAAVQELAMKASSIFSPEETQQPEKMVYTTLTNDPIMSDISDMDAALANDMWFHDALSVLSNLPEQEYAEILDNPENFLS